ncbi:MULTISPECIES: hypothetical protein [unclassified Streptomyces]|uniref:hypothetical protein n=1 Tax=unclassified Streptomyces TaxID=2593676 RepID=UPI003329195B
MYLVHVWLRRAVEGTVPRELAREFRDEAAGDEGVEHAVVHPVSGRETVVGLFLRLESLAAAERAAAAVCARVLDRHAAWGYEAVSCEVTLMAPFPEP